MLITQKATANLAQKKPVRFQVYKPNRVECETKRVEILTEYIGFIVYCKLIHLEWIM